MRHFKQIASAVTALALTAALALPMTASLTVSADTTYTVTVEDNNAGYTYEIYQIFSGTYANEVLTDIQWGSSVKETSGELKTGLLAAIQAIDIGTADLPNKPFEGKTTAEDIAKVLSAEAETTAKDGAVAKAFAKVIGNYLTTADKVASDDYTDNKYQFTGLTAGYYLVKNTSVPADSAYTRYLLTVVAETTISPKKDKPEVMKKVKENVKEFDDNQTSFAGDDEYVLEDGYNDVADYSIGDVISFKLYGTLPSDFNEYVKYRYTFHDSLDSQFDYVTTYTPVVKIGDTVIPATVTVNGVQYTNYTIVQGTSAHTGSNPYNCNLEIKFTDMHKIYSGNNTEYVVQTDDIVTVEYQAKLNSNAEIGLNGQENDVYLEYSNNPNWDGKGGEGDDDNDDRDEDTTSETEIDTVIVFTYEIDGTKYKNEVGAGNLLGGAEFVLYRVTDSGKRQYALGTAGSDGYVTITGWSAEVDATADLPDGTAKVTSSATGKFGFKGVDDGTYYLKETQTPSGYESIDDVKIEVKATTENNQSYKDSGDYEEASDVLTKLEVCVDDETWADNNPDGTERAGDKKYSEGDVSTGTVSVNVINTEGKKLPSTGGMGTVLFYVIGGILVAGAGVTLITRKRMEEE